MNKINHAGQDYGNKYYYYKKCNEMLMWPTISREIPIIIGSTYLFIQIVFLADFQTQEMKNLRT